MGVTGCELWGRDIHRIQGWGSPAPSTLRAAPAAASTVAVLEGAGCPCPGRVKPSGDGGTTARASVTSSGVAVDSYSLSSLFPLHSASSNILLLPSYMFIDQ